MGAQLNADDRHCLKCFYHFRWGGGQVGCEFILVTGKQRGCEFGRRCKRFVNANPRLRWGIERDLAPGEVPGRQTERKGRPQIRQAIDQDAVAKLKSGRTWSEIAAATGTSSAMWTNLSRNGKVSPQIAEKVIETYGIDIRAK